MLIPSATGVPTLQKAVVPIEAYDDALSNDRAATGLRAVPGSWNGASTGTVISGWCGVDKKCARRGIAPVVVTPLLRRDDSEILRFQFPWSFRHVITVDRI